MDLILKFGLIFITLFVYKVCGDDTIELSCSSDEDCHTFTDLNIAAKCIKTCLCFLKSNGSEIACTPRVSTVYNEISNCPCRVVNTECLNDQCVCKHGFVKSEDKLKCLTKEVQLGKSCDVDDQCRRLERNSMCKDGICQCKEDFFQINNSTCRSLALRKGEERDSFCNFKDKMCGPNQECIKEKCVCSQDYIYGLNKSECIPYASFGENCIDQIQCEMGIGNGTVCGDDINKCVCDKSHSKTMVNGRKICQRHVQHMQECQKDADCAKYFDDPRMWCEKERCVCAEGYQLSDGIHFTCVLVEKIPSSKSESKSICASLVIFIITSMLSLCFM